MLIHAELAPDANPDPQHCIPLPLHVLSLRVLHFQLGIRLQGIVSRDFSASFLASEHRLIFLPWPWTRFYVPKAYLARFLYSCCFLNCSVLGLPSKFRSEKISRNRLEMGFKFHGKMLIPRNSVKKYRFDGIYNIYTKFLFFHRSKKASCKHHRKFQNLFLSLNALTS